MIKHQNWAASTSIHKMEFERRPLLNDISLVIPTLSRTILEQCLYWILMGSRWPACLIVVEQGSSTDVVDWLESVRQIGVPVKHIRSPQRGRSAGINRGLEQTETRFVAITDDDCFVSEDWLMKMVDKLRQSPEAVVTGQVEAAGEDMIVVVKSKVPSVQSRPKLKFDAMSGGNMGTSLAVFKKVGLFQEDPVMATAEDAEWAYRALRTGITIRYEPDVVLAHFGWRDESKRLEQYRHYALSHGGFYGKYLRRGDLFILARAAGHFFRAYRRWVRGTLNGDTELAQLGWAYCANLLPGIMVGLRSKMRPGELK
ncbi:MAG TPA: glycosyltransferase [Anaerolineales bacterium]|jgi:GT2 family glycosyltransferase|nr:glycosyltransferase [Anaerolineales bacterium]